jgi:hypothetical protein
MEPSGTLVAVGTIPKFVAAWADRHDGRVAGDCLDSRSVLGEVIDMPVVRFGRWLEGRVTMGWNGDDHGKEREESLNRMKNWKRLWFVLSICD